MDLNQIRLALHIASHGSLTQTSVALGIEQSVISRQLSALEKEYGERLFHRTGRGMAPTDFGAAIFPRLQELLDEADRIHNEIKAEAGIISGDVRIGFLPALSSRVICSLVPQIRAEHDRIRLHFFEGSNGQLEDWLANGTIDLAILYRYGGNKLATERVLGTNDAHLIGPIDAAIFRDFENGIPLRELSGLPLVLPNAPNSLRNVLSEAARREGVTLDIVAEADSIVMQKSLVRDGQAFAILGALAIDPAESQLLRSAKIIDPIIRRSAVLASSTRKPLTTAMRTVLRQIELVARPLLNR